MDKLNRRDAFFVWLCDLIFADSERRKLEIDEAGPDAGALRKEVNEKRQQDIRDLRRFIYGRKAEAHCAGCWLIERFEKIFYGIGGKEG